MKILIVTAGNRRYKEQIKVNMLKVEELGYPMIVYDLGNDWDNMLNFGIPFPVENKNFQEKGYYVDIGNYRKSMSLFKPAVIKNAMKNNYDKFLVWLDGDTILNSRIDEIVGDYDVGVTLRPPFETARFPNTMNFACEPNNRQINGEINAGVLFFNGSSEEARRFIENWVLLTEELQNDQWALNVMVNPNRNRLRTETYTIMGKEVKVEQKLGDEFMITKDAHSERGQRGLRVKVFPAEIYNDSYFFDEEKTKIFHYKG